MIKKIIPVILETNKEVGIIIDELGLKQITDVDTITKFVNDVLASNPESIELHKSGKDRAFGFLVGQIMKVSQGQANPQIVNKILSLFFRLINFIFPKFKVHPFYPKYMQPPHILKEKITSNY